MVTCLFHMDFISMLDIYNFIVSELIIMNFFPNKQ